MAWTRRHVLCLGYSQDQALACFWSLDNRGCFAGRPLLPAALPLRLLASAKALASSSSDDTAVASTASWCFVRMADVDAWTPVSSRYRGLLGCTGKGLSSE
jgi:hypothetical protein